MKVAIASTGKTLESEVSNVFGRCPYFIVAEVNKEIGDFEAFENVSINQMGGAGISAAQTIAEKGVTAVIAGNVGPRALDVFGQFSIDTYRSGGTVKDALQKLINSELVKNEASYTNQ
jgi:predicted Fe-Mo cluster-binding NifX family protein